MTKINLDLISGIDQQLFIEKGMRGGISYIAHRHAEANNKYMENFDPEKESSYITHLDANNLYGWAMSQSLPFSDFKWLEPESIILEKYTDYTKKDFILEVDGLHNDYPLAQKILVKKKISSGTVHKLVTKLMDKEKYVLHYRNPQLYLKLFETEKDP